MTDGDGLDRGDRADGRRPRPPRRPTPESLHNRALFYLERYAAPAAHLRMLLRRRALRAAAAHGLPASEVEAMVDGVIARLVAAGLLDDPAYAEMRVRRLAESGRSERGIRNRLRQKGVAPEVIEQALDCRRGEQAAEPDLASAIVLARRRRLGPYRPAQARAAARSRDLAVLVRAGFAVDLARRVVDAETAAALEDKADPAA